MSPLRASLTDGGPAPARFLWSATSAVRADRLVRGTCLAGAARDLAGRSVLVAARDQLAAALALIELDGVARRLVVCTPDLTSAQLQDIARRAEVDAIVADTDVAIDARVRACCAPAIETAEPPPATLRTEWVLLTSGTTGTPKLVVHDIASLTAPIAGGPSPDTVWGTFYDIRRYGGLQVLLRALLGHGSLVLSEPGEPVASHLARLAVHRVTHVSGTPTHWRRALMSAEARTLSPEYIRLSGEIADQAILNALTTCYPGARVVHAFASTEAGVAFEVGDGREGFPASAAGVHGDVDVRVDGGSLRIRSRRRASRYLGDGEKPIADADGFIDTGDVVERRDERFYFLGRRDGVINVGGQKVYAEEVEAAINRHPAVRMSKVWSRRSPIAGSLVAADVVLDDNAGSADDCAREILRVCHDRLPSHKVPVTLRFVPALEAGAAGKLARHA